MHQYQQNETTRDRADDKTYLTNMNLAKARDAEARKLGSLYFTGLLQTQTNKGCSLDSRVLPVFQFTQREIRSQHEIFLLTSTASCLCEIYNTRADLLFFNLLIGQFFKARFAVVDA